MLKRLKRKILILFVLLVALTTVTSAPSKASRVFCDVAPLDSGCYGWICCNDYGGCWCVN